MHRQAVETRPCIHAFLLLLFVISVLFLSLKSKSFPFVAKPFYISLSVVGISEI